MSFSTQTLVLVGQQILIYGGLSMIAIGMFGSLMIVLIFGRPPLNQNPCSTYLIVNGILSFLFLPLYYFPVIATFGFNIDLSIFGTAACKFLMSYAGFSVTSIFVINCFILFDRYAITSRSVRIRSLSSKKVARRFIGIGLFLVWCFIGLPIAVLFENVPLGTSDSIICTSRSTMFLLFAALFYYPILEGILPIVLAVYFWFATRKQIRNLNNEQFIRRFDKQITRMYMFQIIANAIASFPFATINLYRALATHTVTTETQTDIIQFVRLMALWLFYLQYCTDFYIYIITSSEIRTQAYHVLCLWYRCCTNRVHVMTRALW